MPSSTAPTSRGRSCPTGRSTRSRRSFDRNIGPQQIELRRALELADRELAAATELSLTRFPEKPGLEHGAQPAVGELGAAPIYVEGADRRLAGRGSAIGAVPPLAAIARLEEIAQRVSLLALLRADPRIADDAQTSEHAVGIEQCRDDHRKIEHLGPGVLGNHSLRAMCLRPIFELVVIAEIDLAQAVRLGPALFVIGPAAEQLLRWAAIAAAGIIVESIERQCRC